MTTGDNYVAAAAATFVYLQLSIDGRDSVHEFLARLLHGAYVRSRDEWFLATFGVVCIFIKEWGVRTAAIGMESKE